MIEKALVSHELTVDCVGWSLGLCCRAVSGAVLPFCVVVVVVVVVTVAEDGIDVVTAGTNTTGVTTLSVLSVITQPPLLTNGASAHGHPINSTSHHITHNQQPATHPFV